MAHTGAILTAAGESRRMGRPKALLTWRGKPLLQYQLDSLRQAGVAEVVVVLGHGAQDLIPYVTGPGTRYVVNPRYAEGRASSIKVGLAALSPAVEHIVLLAVDQPRTPSCIAAVLRTHLEKGALITAPRYRGRGGHPLVFSASLRDELARITEEGQGVRQVLRDHRDDVLALGMEDPTVRLDLNTPEEYAEALERYGRSDAAADAEP